MSRAKHASKRKRGSKALSVLGVAGLSLSLASGACAATTVLVADPSTHNSLVSHDITLDEEEIADVSLTTFYVFEKENAGASRHGVTLTCGGGCWTGTYYTSPESGNDAYPPPPRAVRPAHARAPKHVLGSP